MARPAQVLGASHFFKDMTMALDRWIALAILSISLIYGYTAFFTMDALLPPFMKFNPVWPSTFPKVLSVLAVVTSLVIVLGIEKAPPSDKTPDIDYRRLGEYHLIPALTLLAMMVAYALLLRPLGFLASTFLFLSLSSLILGERRYVIIVLASSIAAGGIWYLVEQVLGIFLRPWPLFIVGG